MRKDDVIQIRVTVQEKEEWKRTAGLVPLAVWLRELARQAAQQKTAGVAATRRPADPIPAPVLDATEDHPAVLREPGGKLVAGIPGLKPASGLAAPERRTVTYDRRGAFDQTRR